MMDEETSESFISWQEAITGPYSIREIRSMLKLGKIHSLYKVQVDGAWILLRDHLADIDRMTRAAAKLLDTRSYSPPIPKVVPDEYDLVAPTVAPTQTSSETYTAPTTPDSTQANGIATASFILSLCFFIPVLNGITQLLSLVFGHLALAQMGPNHVGKSRALASTALWITYVQVGFLASSMAWLAITETPDLSFRYLEMHGHMVGIALTALIGSGLLMLGIKLLSDHLLDFRTCFIGTLLPASVSTLGMVIISSLFVGSSPTGGRMIATVAIFQVFMFAVQMLFWAQFIKLPDNEKLGLGRAALASLLYSIIFLFIGILYLMLLAALNPLHY